MLLKTTADSPQTQTHSMRRVPQQPVVYLPQTQIAPTPTLTQLPAVDIGRSPLSSVGYASAPDHPDSAPFGAARGLGAAPLFSTAHTPTPTLTFFPLISSPFFSVADSALVNYSVAPSRDFHGTDLPFNGIQMPARSFCFLKDLLRSQVVCLAFAKVLFPMN